MKRSESSQMRSSSSRMKDCHREPSSAERAQNSNIVVRVTSFKKTKIAAQLPPGLEEARPDQQKSLPELSSSQARREQQQDLDPYMKESDTVNPPPQKGETRSNQQNECEEEVEKLATGDNERLQIYKVDPWNLSVRSLDDQVAAANSSGAKGKRDVYHVPTGRQSARSANDEMNVNHLQPRESEEGQGHDNKQLLQTATTPDKIKSSQLEWFNRDASPGNSNAKSVRSLGIHTKKNQLKQSHATSNNNADLVDDLGIQNENELTRNRVMHTKNLTTKEENKQGLLDQEIVVSDRIELLDQQSIDLTDFKSFNATSERSKNVFSALVKDTSTAIIGVLDKKQHPVINVAIMENKKGGGAKNEHAQTVNTDLIDVNSQQITTSHNFVQGVASSAMPQANLELSDQIIVSQMKLYNNPHLKSPKRQSIKKTAKQSAQKLTYSPGAQKHSNQQSALKPFIFGKGPSNASSAVGFNQVAKPVTPGKKEVREVNTMDSNAKNQKNTSTTNKTINLNSLSLAGQKQQSNSKQLFKQRAGHSTGQNFKGESLVTEVNGRGLIGKNQQPNSCMNIYSGFKPSKIIKSKRNFLSTHSNSPRRSGANKDGLPSRKDGAALSSRKDKAIVNMTPIESLAPLGEKKDSKKMTLTHDDQVQLEQESGEDQHSDQDASADLPGDLISGDGNPEATSRNSDQNKFARSNSRLDQLSQDFKLTAKLQPISAKKDVVNFNSSKKAAESQVSLPDVKQQPPSNKKIVLNVQNPPPEIQKKFSQHQFKTTTDFDSTDAANQNFKSLIVQGSAAMDSKGFSRVNLRQNQHVAPETQLISQQESNKVESYGPLNARQTMLQNDSQIEIKGISAISNQQNVRNQTASPEEFLKAAGLAANRTEESRLSNEDLLRNRILTDNKRNNQLSRQRILTSLTQQKNSSSGVADKQYGSVMESSIANINPLPGSKHDSHKLIYAEKVLPTQSDEQPLSIKNAIPAQNLNTLAMHVPLLNPDKQSAAMAVLANVDEINESTNNIATLRRSGAQTVSQTDQSAEAGFYSLAKTRLEQRTNRTKTTEEVNNYRDLKNNLVIKDEKAESVTAPQVPQMTLVENMIQHTDRPGYGGKLLASREESSVTGTHQQAQYLMSNRYSNRESMYNAPGKESGNQSYSFGAGNVGAQLNNVPRDGKSVANEETAKKQSTMTTKGKKQEQVKNVTLSSVSPFKTSRKSKLSSISPSQHKKNLTTESSKQVNASSSQIGAQNQFGPPNQQQLKTEGNQEVNSLKSQVDEQKDAPYKYKTTASPKAHFDTSIEVEDQQQVQITDGLMLQQTQQQQRLAFNKPSADPIKEYGYYLHGVQQFDQLPPPSSGYVSQSRAPEPYNQSHLQAKDEEVISSPKLTENSNLAGFVSKELISEEEKYAELLSITDPLILEERLKGILQTKNQFFIAENATPGINITNEENKELKVVDHSDRLTNLQTLSLSQTLGSGSHNLLQQTGQAYNNIFSHQTPYQQFAYAPPYQLTGQYMDSNAASGMMGVTFQQQDDTHAAQQRYNLFNVPPRSDHLKKPRTAGGANAFKKTSTLLQGMTKSGRQNKMTAVQKYPQQDKSSLTKPATAHEKLSSRDRNPLARSMMPFGLASGGSEKNLLSGTMSVFQRQLQSGKIQASLSLPTLKNEFKVDGKNPLRKFQNEIVQINLLKQMKVILDPTAQSQNLYKAGYNFIKLLFGESYKPNETEVHQIVHFICSNPSIPLENLIRVSTTVSNQQKEQINQKVADNKSQASKRSGTVKKIGFGRAVSKTSVPPPPSHGKFHSTGYLTLGDPRNPNGKLINDQCASPNQKNEDQKAKAAKQSSKLNAISRRMINDYKKKKDDLNTYKKKVLTRQIDELRKEMGSEIHLAQLTSKKFGTRSLSNSNCMTPLRSKQNELSQCSTFDNLTPVRVDHETGAATYITQMAQVDMEMKRKYDTSEAAFKSRTPSRIQARSQTDLTLSQAKKTNLFKHTVPAAPTIATAGKLSLLLTAEDQSLKTYLASKKRMSMANQINSLAQKKRHKLHILNRMVPSEKTRLTEMLHQYISAHKFHSASEVRKNGGSNGAFSLVTGQSEAIKEEYSAVTMHPKEKVSQLLKYRDELRKLARDSNRISSDKAQIQVLHEVAAGKNPHQQSDHFELFAGESSTIYEQRRQKVMSQFKTVEKIKRMENGSRNLLPARLQHQVKNQKLLVMRKSEGVKTHSADLMAHLDAGGDESQAQSDLNINVDADEELQAAKQQQEEAMTKHFEQIENDVNQEPVMIYKKNNLLLEKIILDRALNKVQKRRFIKSNMPK